MVEKNKQYQLLDKSAYTFTGCLTNPAEGLLLGNGDMAATVTVSQHEIRFRLTKSDCWDSRYQDIHARDCLTHDQLISWEKEYGFQWPTPVECDAPTPTWRENPENLHVYYASRTFHDYMHGPNPKPMGDFVVRHNGMYGVKISGKLEISTGLFTAVCDFGVGVLTLKAFIAKQSNTLHVRVESTDTIPKLQFILEKYPDNSAADMPLPVHEMEQERFGWLTQRIPAGYGVDEFAWCLAANYPAIRNNSYARGSYRIHLNNKMDKLNFQTIRTSTLEAGESFDCVVAATTTRQNGANLQEAAKALAEYEHEPDFTTAFSRQKDQMTAFWKKSGIWMEDEEAAKIWYRGIYAGNVFIKDNGMFPGVVCNIPVEDYSPWHGAQVWNMNIQRWTVHAFVTNHLEWIEAYTSALEKNRDVFQSFARENFGLEGIFPDFITIPFVPAEHAYVNNKWGRSMSMLGWIVQPVWFYYEYTKDLKWLKERAYPILREAAIFYAGFQKKYQKEPGADLYPSMQILEGPGWMPEFQGNRNLTDDLANFELVYNWAIQAAELLNVDPELKAQWQEAKSALPPIAYTWDGEKGTLAFGYSKELGYTDDTPYYLSKYLHGKWKNKESTNFPYDAQALWLIYPFEYLQGDGESDLEKVAAWRIRNMYDYTCHPNPLDESHGSVPYGALLRVDGRKWYDHTIKTIEECTLESGGYQMYIGSRTHKDSGAVGRMPETYVHPIQYISDILLQTQGGIVRVFPALPKGKAASFSGFRARGGFSVSADTDGANVHLEILSTLGGKCCIKLDEREVYSASTEILQENGYIYIDTEKGQTYSIDMRYV